MKKLRNDLYDDLRDELEDELRDTFVSDLIENVKTDILEDIRDEMKEQLVNLEEEMKEKLREELKVDLTSEVEEEVTNELIARFKLDITQLKSRISKLGRKEGVGKASEASEEASIVTVKSPTSPKKRVVSEEKEKDIEGERTQQKKEREGSPVVDWRNTL
ncbi:hypothetical protein L486_02370 [Kwoniella mangroviensis CBS 10435]|uniref:Uncharacterized protein n=1 Tax=Kwoniella mangroviensis CBS 10435 TaxID=1331196 RepID=A0A1B9IVZ6_9TREE|nr:hypothetical protein L486_02370 [Kwoniella mangroviensis CBS 10435]